MSGRRTREVTPGLFFGFEEYRSASRDDYRDVMIHGLVVLDANVLLDLYRYQAQTRSDLLSAMARLETLWLPHQVLNEFWNNRLATIRGSRKVTNATVEELNFNGEKVIETINQWANTRGAASDTKIELASIVRSAIQAVADRLDKISKSEAADVPEETFMDPVLRELERLLSGRVGQGFDAEREAIEREEAARRIDNEIPPGYKDKDKKKSSYGDYFVWAQILDEAESRSCDVLFITRDKKPDWWRVSPSSEIMGPRGELVRELMSRTDNKGRLFFLTPERFLAWAKDLLGVKISGESIVDMERVESQQSSRGIEWTQEELATFDSLLDQSDNRVTIEQLPEGSAGESYFDVLLRICSLVGDTEKDFDAFIDEFQVEFPRISVRSEAKRRASCLIKLDLAKTLHRRISLTEIGAELIANPDIEVVRELFLDRIKGARELLAVSRKGGRIGDTRAKLRSEVPPGLTQNQAILILRWLEQLQLV
jgi:hypothetical protein